MASPSGAFAVVDLWDEPPFCGEVPSCEDEPADVPESAGVAEAVAAVAVSMAAPSPATNTPLANQYLPLTPVEQSLW